MLGHYFTAYVNIAVGLCEFLLAFASELTSVRFEEFLCVSFDERNSSVCRLIFAGTKGKATTEAGTDRNRQIHNLPLGLLTYVQYYEYCVCYKQTELCQKAFKNNTNLNVWFSGKNKMSC